MLPLILTDLIGHAVGRAIREVSRDPAVPLSEVAAPQVAAEVAGKVAEIIRADPQVKEIEGRIAHVTSTEAWYQSRANWSAIVSGLTPMVAIVGYNLSPEDQITVAGVCVAIGNLVALYLARRARTAKKPLGA